ncbi:SWIM zinc finger family protein [Sphingobacterium sp.]|uniref:SWIM zinc finger family protein n=1 Tax=Sphingobacterium sp. TaxID=341027 RepID=UPI0031D171D6
MNLDFEYQYQHASTIATGGRDKSFILAHCSEIEQDNQVPCFFHGNIINSFVASKCLSTLGKTVRSHFAISPDQRINMRDPIVSVGNNQLHFEAFSSCNSVYARIDVLQTGIDGEFIQSGCTNVDFNDMTIRAFNTVGRTDKLIVGVGSNELKIITARTESTEKKVSLPDRWIKGLGNVQVYLSQMELAFKLNKIEALQLFKAIPKTAVKPEYFLFRSGNSYTFSATAKPNSLKIGGIHRLNLLENLLVHIDSVSFYKHEDQQSTAVVLDFRDIQMLFLLSESVYRGFSGESKHIENLLVELPEEWLLGINNYFKTNEVFQPTLISMEYDIQLGTMQTMQASLSSMGLLGYDLLSNNYFYRKLPFKLSRLKRFNPRLQNAIKLFNEDAVLLLQNDKNGIKAEVKSSADLSYIVVGRGDDLQCTCTWFTNNRTNRGLCKHIMAVKMKLGE